MKDNVTNEPENDQSTRNQETPVDGTSGNDSRDILPENAPADEASRCDKGCHHCCTRCDTRGKLHCFNWLDDIPGGYADDDMVEVQFKNTRKGFYKNSLNIPLEIGDLVAVEASPGHDIGRVTMTGALVRLQMRKANIKPGAEVRRVFRKAKDIDITKFEEAKARENDTMIRSRQIAESLGLNMKIGDVEYQGDGSKAIFYYIADERVDFRQLIKVLAETFHVRIEMKQIGARQEAGRVGGIGPCGRPLCCASWMTNFVSVATSAARYQDISLNPQKLAGQCAKLKCCLNFEMDAYAEASKKLPPRNIRLETADNTYYHFKTDIFKGEITYSTDKTLAANLVTIDAERVFEIIELNKRGEKPLSLKADGSDIEDKRATYNDLLDQNELTRFDNKKKKKKKKKKNPSASPEQNSNAKDSKPQNE
ncbi:MAG: hypothetical protein J1F20_01320 [Muribaculaceae bacterium]|nr:hypothetical protein [Muribaculaceae bacterium]